MDEIKVIFSHLYWHKSHSLRISWFITSFYWAKQWKNKVRRLTKWNIYSKVFSCVFHWSFILTLGTKYELKTVLFLQINSFCGKHANKEAKFILNLLYINREKLKLLNWEKKEMEQKYQLWIDTGEKYISVCKSNP